MLGCWFSWSTSSRLELAIGMGQECKLTFSVFEYLNYLENLKFLINLNIWNMSNIWSIQICQIFDISKYFKNFKCLKLWNQRLVFDFIWRRSRFHSKWNFNGSNGGATTVTAELNSAKNRQMQKETILACKGFRFVKVITETIVTAEFDLVKIGGEIARTI